MQLTESDEGKALIGLVGVQINEGAGGGGQPASPTAEPSQPSAPSTPEPTPERADLERRADAGDGEAAIELRKLEKADREQASAAAKVKNEAELEVKKQTFRDLLDGVDFSGLTEAQQMRAAVTFTQKGPVVAANLVRELVNGGGGGSPPRTPEEEAALAQKNRETAAAQRGGGGAPAISGGEYTGGPPPIEIGTPPEKVLEDYAEWAAQQT